MTPVTDRSFGLLIAYLLPGFSALWLWGRRVPAINSWLATAPQHSPSVGGFLYVTVSSVAVGLVLSTLRWAIVDRLHHHTGLTAPKWRGAEDGPAIGVYQLMVDLHYRYYQFYGAFLLLAVGLLLSPPGGELGAALRTASGRLWLVALASLFLAASRDTLEKCYSRTPSLWAFPDSLNSDRNEPMTNGGPHDACGEGGDDAGVLLAVDQASSALPVLETAKEEQEKASSSTEFPSA
ncbi:hypothetical protein [Botrimarina mediterranea]|uniref:Uncharacterized protein n=1 Tax=Botrimarina mediterranea TaxID=2528022 RepID=A0A518K7D7_9BACT|nr:hypothetical protein [Botrimarina mediterranea]QDV73677.1 hypothetical protein Spa11_18760 [Botrimarina mediterranea]QDV78267.1 hypothetical protein K2D_18740 [Planctomycetes bacterium K2D]